MIEAQIPGAGHGAEFRSQGVRVSSELSTGGVASPAFSELGGTGVLPEADTTTVADLTARPARPFTKFNTEGRTPEEVDAMLDAYLVQDY